MKYIRYNKGINISNLRFELFIFAEIDGNEIQRSITMIHYKIEVIMMEISTNNDEQFSLLNQLFEYHDIDLNDKSHSIIISESDFEAKYNQKLDKIKQLNPDDYSEFMKSYYSDAYPSIITIFMKMRDDLGDNDLYKNKGLQITNHGIINITYPEYDTVIKILNNFKIHDDILATGYFLDNCPGTDYTAINIDRSEFEYKFKEFMEIY